ncbi:MAG: DNA repair protein RecO [Chloroflexi bacterium]|nr:DNA repair protein RecO [Chloroflexota bacterium]
MSERSRVFKTPAVVLRRLDYGETDLILTLFTPYYGKLRAIAKGARRPISRSTGHVELYMVTQMVLSRGRDLHIVTQAELEEPFLALSKDLRRIGYASHFAELLDRFAVDNQENRQAYDLLVDGLHWLCEESIDLELAARYYELRLLDVMGYAPSFFQCAVSGIPLEAEDQLYSPAEGGVVAAAYATDASNMIPLPLDVFKLCRYMSRHKWPQVKALRLRPHHHRTLERVLHATLAYILEQRLQSIAFLRRITNLHTDEE